MPLIDNDHATPAEARTGSGDPHDQIVRIESEIEKLAEAIEGCRKLIVISKAVVALGLIVLLAAALGAIRLDFLAVMVAFAAVVGGAVVFGSNTSTSNQFSAQVQAAERHRSELIGGIDLHLVSEPLPPR